MAIQPEEYKFGNDNDFLGLEPFGRNLQTWVNLPGTANIFLVDAAWGTGKTVFSKQWQNLLEADGQIVIRFDAFEADLVDDAFASIIASIAQCLVEKGHADKKSRLVEKASAVWDTVKNHGPPLAARSITKAILPSDSETAKIFEDATVELAGRSADAVFKREIDALSRRQAKIKALWAELEDVAAQSSFDRIVLIIDELDRCRPDFALQVLDLLNHVFRTQSVASVIFCDVGMMRSLAEARFGVSGTTQSYLEKFYDVQVDLPKGATKSRRDICCLYEKFLSRYCENHPKSNWLKNAYAESSFSALAKKHSSSYRILRKCIEHFVLVASELSPGETDVDIILALVWVKYNHFDLACQFISTEIDPSKVMEVLPKHSNSERYHLGRTWARMLEQQNSQRLAGHAVIDFSKRLSELWQLSIQPIKVS